MLLIIAVVKRIQQFKEKRQQKNMASFPFQLNRAFQEEESPSTFYCISMQWFREWEGFVKAKDSGKLCSVSNYG